MDMIDPPACPLCQGTKYQLVAQEETNGEMLGIQKCASCGLNIVWPRLANHQEPYKKFTEETFDKKYGAIDRGERLHDRHQNYLEEVGLVKKYAQTGSKVLDVGCNAGWLLGYLKAAGLDIEGVEPSAFLAGVANRRTGAKIHNSYLHEVADRDAAFDCITATDVIEHIAPENIDEFIAAIHRLLKPGGRVIIKTPNVRFTLAKHKLTSWVPKSIRQHLLKALDVWNAKEHVLQWDAVTLPAMFRKNKLEQVALFVPKPIETANSPFIAKVSRKLIYKLAHLFKNEGVPWFAQDICLVAERRSDDV